MSKIFLLAVSVMAATQTGRMRASDIVSNSLTVPHKCGGEVNKILTELRSQMKNSGSSAGIQAYFIPMSDAHQSEYISEHDQRLQYITKFTGSAAEAVVTDKEAVMWTDSRYHLQAEQELDPKCWILMKKGLPNVPNTSEWLVDNLSVNSSVGVDPFLLTAKHFLTLKSVLRENGHELLSISHNLIDAIWIEQPPLANGEIITLDIKFSGKESGRKISDVMDDVKQHKGESIVITALDDVAWLLNLRGSDIPYNPVFFSYVLLSPAESVLFVNNETFKESARMQIYREKSHLILKPYEDILSGLTEIVNKTHGKIITSTGVSQAISNIIPEERRIEKNIVAAIKSVKNPIEAHNMDKAHMRDGFALIQYLHWLDTTIDKENVTEISGSEKLTQFRRQQEHYRGKSFEVISAVGKHAAMAHYSPSMKTNKQITRKDIYLVDSGGQYWDGTTDVTRTVHFGNPSKEEKTAFTLVLKGFIALASSVFPKKTPISYFDNIARRSLWQNGLDYGHGTGHGVGMYLYVHEYPPLINAHGTETLQPNIFTSNEPGFYKENSFGIRIEDVIQVIESDLKTAFSGEGALTFRSITYAPLQTKLIETELLTKEEVIYVNSYNERVLHAIGPILLKRRLMDTYRWLANETSKIAF